MRTIVLMIALLGLAACAAGGAGTITKLEARTLPAVQVERRVMAQLADLVSEDRPSRRQAPVNPLTSMSFSTEPYATDTPGLCRVDTLAVLFRPLRAGRGDANTPVRASGFRATSYYRFLRRPALDDDFLDVVTPPDDAACREAGDPDVAYFVADDEEAARTGYLALLHTLEAADAETPAFALTCELWRTEADRTCLEVLRGLEARFVYAIDRCEPGRDAAPGAYCRRVEIGDRSLRIVTTPIAYGPGARPSLTPLSVHIDSLIIMVHEIVD